MSITLLSDFGLHDPSVAVAKGILLQHADTGLIDISHEIKPFYTPEAAYLLAAAHKNFPEGSCHVLLFDIFSEEIPRLILSEHNGHYFLSPDNGLLPMALGELPAQSWLCYEQRKDHSFIDWLHATGESLNQLHKDGYIPSLPPWTLKKFSPATNTCSTISCNVLHIDRYENIILDFTKQQYESLSNGLVFRMQFMQVEEINEISAAYHAVREGYKLCRFNSNGYLEICINRGRAASLFGFRLGSKHNEVKITFE